MMSKIQKPLTANDVRKKFLDFFASKGHTIVASDSVVPKDDPTVLFTTAGMQQFKPNFLGIDKSLKRAATSQKCLRTDDLDKIGKTAFHHTFFEMLGNFSFGDYFKKDAIAWAWEFLTKELQIPAKKLWVSVYKDDAEAYNHWVNDVKVPADKIVRLGDKSNFWPANAKQDGPNGPCGPCSEIFYDYGVNPDCPNGDKCDPDCSCGRFSEIWNLVFTQFNRKEGGVLEPLPAKNIDTGMGLERLVAVVQGKTTNYETDLFAPIIQAIDKETKDKDYSLDTKDKYIIADHIRAIVFAINDRVNPSNEGRGYVVKKLIIDATDKMIPQGKKGIRLYKLVPTVIKVMKDQYPELSDRKDIITREIYEIQGAYLRNRDEKLPEILLKIQNILDNERISTEEKTEKLGELRFFYRDTHGLTDDSIAKAISDKCAADTDFAVKINKHLVGMGEQSSKHMEKQREKSRAGSKMTGDVFADADFNLDVPKTQFLGYTENSGKGKILKLFKDTLEANEISKGDNVKILLDKTPFYAEAGGQIGDTGYIKSVTGKIRVTDTQKKADIYIHSGIVEEGTVKVNEDVETEIDIDRRMAIMRNHTATHLLQAALREILGTHVQQQGSLVAEDRLRFDFTHRQAITKDQLLDIEDTVNTWVNAKDPVETKEMSLDEAKKSGALAFFAEKYGQKVRVVSIGNYSKEFCGGTHVKATSQIEKIKITGEGSVAQGIRRLEAKTGKQALEFIDQQAKDDQAKLEALKLKDQEAEVQKSQFADILSEIKKEIGKIENKKASQIVTYIIKHDNVTVESLRNAADYIKQNLPSAAIVIGSASGYVLAAVTDDLIKHNIKANDIIERIKPMINGNGGGRPQMAQAGTKDPSKIEAAINTIRIDLEKKIRNGN